MYECVAEFAALVDRARSLRRRVAWNAAGKRELPKQLAQPIRVPADVGIDLGVCPFEIGIGDHARPAMPRPADIDHVEVACLDRPVEMGIDEIQSRCRAPMAKEAGLDVLGTQRLAEQGIVEKIDLANGQIVGCPPIAIEQSEVRFCWLTGAHTSDT